ncbi:hypothetical protein [Arthrobacter celericrescens]|uniref:hypothetical protein n=1 Tax=Arthrobacter celericrescens TaxID=2320851 RepID=UPI000EA2459A|nr:hypothetical protein [Arthrobacter celericrescens]
MTESIHPEVQRTLSAIQVRVSRQMTTIEHHVRVAEVLRLFDIDATGNETGVYYGDQGVELEDQPLVWAIHTLVERRFGIPEGL